MRFEELTEAQIEENLAKAERAWRRIPRWSIEEPKRTKFKDLKTIDCPVLPEFFFKLPPNDPTKLFDTPYSKW